MSTGARGRSALLPTLLGLAYGRAAARRRSWYARHPFARRALARPVISVGNLVVGGSGKTPLVAALARALAHDGERPSILSRGYARRVTTDGVLVVCDQHRTIEPVERSGDEPQMLARSLTGVPVLVGSDRYLAGCLAERRFGCTVHLLDDGFQHLELRRDVDRLIVAPEDLDEAVLPGGRLREPWSAAAVADAILVPGDEEAMARVATALGAPVAFRLRAHAEAPVWLNGSGRDSPLAPGARVAAMAGIARPDRFVASVRGLGHDVVHVRTFRDHHWFTRRQVARILARARAAGAEAVLTTEKDAVRLACLGLGETSPPVAVVPLVVTVEPGGAFRAWLRGRLEAARVVRQSA